MISLQMVEQEPAEQPARIVHLIETLGPGGAERLIHTNLKHLDPARFHSTVITVFSSDDYWADPVRRLGVRIESLNCSGYRDLPTGAARLLKWLRNERPDLLHTHLWAANIIGRVAGTLAGVPVISSIHDSDYEPETWNDGSDVSAWKRRLIRSMDRWTARFGCERLVAVSEYVRQSTHRHLGVPLGHIDLLYNPLDVGELETTATKGRADLLRELNLPAESVVLLNVGRVTPQKGLLYAIRALPIVKDRHPAVQLLSAGGVGDRNWVEHLRGEAQAAGVSDRVHILGPRRDVPDLLRACDLFVFPSLHEGLGIALIEAMAMGCACVAAETGPIPEVINHGADGWLVSPRNAHELAEAICALLANAGHRIALGEAARVSALARFQPRPSADRLAAIYDSVIRPGAQDDSKRAGAYAERAQFKRE